MKKKKNIYIYILYIRVYSVRPTCIAWQEESCFQYSVKRVTAKGSKAGLGNSGGSYCNIRPRGKQTPSQIRLVWNISVISPKEWMQDIYNICRIFKKNMYCVGFWILFSLNSKIIAVQERCNLLPITSILQYVCDFPTILVCDK